MSKRTIVIFITCCLLILFGSDAVQFLGAAVNLGIIVLWTKRFQLPSPFVKKMKKRAKSVVNQCLLMDKTSISKKKGKPCWSRSIWWLKLLTKLYPKKVDVYTWESSVMPYKFIPASGLLKVGSTKMYLTQKYTSKLMKKLGVNNG